VRRILGLLVSVAKGSRSTLKVAQQEDKGNQFLTCRMKFLEQLFMEGKAMEVLVFEEYQ
jgi:hypothetical protein